MAKRNCRKARRVDRKKLAKLLEKEGLEPTFTGFMRAQETQVNGEGKRPIEETAAKKFFNGKSVSTESQAKFEKVFGYDFDEIALADDVESLAQRVRESLTMFRNSYYLDRQGLKAVSDLLPGAIDDLRELRSQREYFEGKHCVEGALLAGEVAGALHTHVDCLPVETVRMVIEIGLELLSLPSLDDAHFADCLIAKGQLMHNRVGPGSDAWCKPLTPLPIESVEGAFIQFDRSRRLHELGSGCKGEHRALTQLLSQARVRIQSQAGELNAAEALLCEAKTFLPKAGFESRSHAAIVNSLLATKRGRNSKAIDNLEKARTEILKHLQDEQHPHVAAIDLRLCELDSKKIPPQRVRDAWQVLKASPLRYVGVIDMAQLRKGRSHIFRVIGNA